MEEKSKILRVSDCHTAGFEEVIIESVDEDGNKKSRRTGSYVCNICRQPCKVVEMIVEGIKAE